VAAAVGALEAAVIPSSSKLLLQQQQQAAVVDNDVHILLLNPWMLWHGQGLQQAVQQLPTADVMLQRQLQHLASASCAQHRVLAALRQLLLGWLKQAAAAGVAVEPVVVQLAQLVAAACRGDQLHQNSSSSSRNRSSSSRVGHRVQQATQLQWQRIVVQLPELRRCR
jgi:hypothetical protein